MKKKLFALSLALVILMGLLPFPAGAVTVITSGECGKNGNDVIWALDTDGLLTISGMGEMSDYDSVNAVPWYSYRTQVKSVSIEEYVSTIGKNAFRNCTKLESMKLESQNLTSIGETAFYNCSALKEILLPSGLETIGREAFSFCPIETITLPASVKSINERAFYRCSKLKEIQVEAGNVKYSAVDGVLFEFDSVASGDAETKPDKITCYPAAKLVTETGYTIPEGIKTIGSCAFIYATKLETVKLPAGVKTIEPYAFAYSAVKDIYLPSSLTSIEERAFFECKNLSTSDENGKITKIGTVHFDGNPRQWSALSLAIRPDNDWLTNANIELSDNTQEKIVASGECGERGSNAIWSLNDKGDFVISGEGAMMSYRNETDIPWVSYRSPNEGAESGEEAAPQDLRDQIKTVTIDGDLVEDGVVIRTGITNVGDYAFYKCTNLTTATIPPTVKTIGEYAFSSCTALVDINPPLSEEQTDTSLSGVPLESIGGYAFNACSALTSITFPQTLRTIGERAFLDCNGLTKVIIPPSVTEIGDWAFRRCKALTTFTMEEPEEGENTRMSLGNYALADCESLVVLDFTENLATLGDFALSKCKTLGVVPLPASVTGIGNYVFLSSAAVAEISVGSSEKENQAYCVMNGMLMNKDQTYIIYCPQKEDEPCEIPDTVTSIAPGAFEDASSLKQVIYDGYWEQWLEVEIGENNKYLNNLIEQAAPKYPDNEDPTNEEKTFYCLKASALESEQTTITDATAEQTKFTATVHCGEEDVVALCAIYDEEGRFVSAQTEEMTALGQDYPLSFTLDDGAAKVRLFIMDGNNLPLCPSGEWDVLAPDTPDTPEG